MTPCRRDAMNTEPRRILVCDDNLDSREFIDTALTSLAPAGLIFDVVLVEDGQSALAEVKNAIARSAPFCAAFVDQRMPMGWSGIQTARQIRAVDIDIELVMITAYDDLSKQTAGLHGIGSPEKMLLLKKPLSVEEVIQTALNLSEKWRLNSIRQQQERELAQAHKSLIKSYEELKKAQEVLIHTEKMAAIGRLASGVAHEFNNILTGVLGHSQLALASTSLNEMRDSLNSIMDLGWRAKRIIDGLLNFARKKPGRVRRGNVQQVLENVLILVEKSVNGQDVRIIRDYQEVPDNLFDPDQLSQVFLNILLNARQAAGKNSVEITVGTRYEDGQILITIADNGPGIPNDVLPRIFDPFFTTKGPLGGGNQGGVGLGLSIAMGIIHEHGGKIDVESDSSNGTTFTISLPVSATDAPGIQPDLPVVIVIERDRVIASLAREVLTNDHMNVVVVDNFNTSAGMKSYDAVIIDPFGFDISVFVSYVHDSIEKGVHVLLTPSMTGSKAIISLKKQGVAILNKPYTPDELSLAVKALMTK